MAQYRTMPCQIEAIQWTDNTNEIKSFCGNSCTYSVEDSAWKVGKGIPHEKLVIHTLEGDMVASRNDYIIKGLKGEFYPCKPDVFNQKYELINDTREMHMEQRWIPVSERLPEKGAHTKKPQTNADRIRSMTDEELAIHMMCPNEMGLAEIDCDKSDSCNCYECLLNWLRAER